MLINVMKTSDKTYLQKKVIKVIKIYLRIASKLWSRITFTKFFSLTLLFSWLSLISSKIANVGEI